MEIYDYFIGKKSGCIICGTTEEKPSTLLLISGSRVRDKGKAYPVHIECLRLEVVMNANLGELGIVNGVVIAQVINREMVKCSRI